MARIETDPFYSSPTFSRATAGTDLFKKEDVQALAAAVSTHNHTTGKGAVLEAGSIPAGSITSGMIADATIDTADLKDGAVTSAKILDGTIATADHADASVTNAKLASDTARANLLTNGGFEVWQRGNGPFTTGFTADRWQLSVAGTDSLSVSRNTANVDSGSAASAACVFALGTGAGGTLLFHTTRIADYSQLAGRTVTFSARVRCATANAVRLNTNANGTGGAVAQSAFHSGDGSYQTLTLTHTVPSDATFASQSINFVVSCTAYIDNAMLVVGAVAADYAPLHPADDLARCFRYYESGYPGLPSPTLQGYCDAGGRALATGLFWKVTKAVVPTVTRTGTWTCLNVTGGQPTLDLPSPHGCRIYGAALAAGWTYFDPAPNGSYTAEANP